MFKLDKRDYPELNAEFCKPAKCNFIGHRSIYMGKNWVQLNDTWPFYRVGNATLDGKAETEKYLLSDRRHEAFFSFEDTWWDIISWDPSSLSWRTYITRDVRMYDF